MIAKRLPGESKGDFTNRVVKDAVRLEKALREIILIPNSLTGGDWDEIEKAREIARAALHC